MGIALNEEVSALLNDPETVKALATVDRSGEPHVVFKGSFRVDAAGRLLYLELIESSRTNNNLVHSLWFGRKVALNVARPADGRSFQIKGLPIHCIISGPEFEQYYRQVRAADPQADLSSVWVIQPEELREETYARRRQVEEAEHPLLLHLDRLAK